LGFISDVDAPDGASSDAAEAARLTTTVTVRRTLLGDATWLKGATRARASANISPSPDATQRVRYWYAVLNAAAVGTGLRDETR
jgi:hypothetical protein